MSDATNHPVAKAIDALAVGSIVGTIMGWLPTAATILSMIWFGIQIYESDSFGKFCIWVRRKFSRGH